MIIHPVRFYTGTYMSLTNKSFFYLLVKQCSTAAFMVDFNIARNVFSAIGVQQFPRTTSFNQEFIICISVKDMIPRGKISRIPAKDDITIRLPWLRRRLSIAADAKRTYDKKLTFIECSTTEIFSAVACHESGFDPQIWFNTKMSTPPSFSCATWKRLSSHKKTSNRCQLEFRETIARHD